MRRSEHTLIDVDDDKEINGYLKLNKSNIIISDDDSQDEQYEHEVDKGYFSSSGGEEQNDDDVIQVQKKDQFDSQIKERLRLGLIGNIPISEEQKMKLRNSKTLELGDENAENIDDISDPDSLAKKSMEKTMEELIKPEARPRSKKKHKRKDSKRKKALKEVAEPEVEMHTIHARQSDQVLVLPPIPQPNAENYEFVEPEVSLELDEGY